MSAAGPVRRKQIIEDGHALLDWLAANEDLPVSSFGIEMLAAVSRTDIDGVSQAMGERTELTPSGALRATHREGLASYVAYSAPVIPAKCGPEVKA